MHEFEAGMPIEETHPDTDYTAGFCVLISLALEHAGTPALVVAFLQMRAVSEAKCRCELNLSHTGLPGLLVH